MNVFEIRVACSTPGFFFVYFLKFFVIIKYEANQKLKRKVKIIKMKIFFRSGNGYVAKDFTFNEFGAEKFQIVGDFQNSGEVRHSYSAMSALADNYEKDILVVNARPSEKLEIVKLVDMQKFLYEQKKAKKDSEKKQKASQQKQKEIKFHVNIADNDLNTKVEHVKKFIADNCKVKIVLELRGREAGMKDFAEEVWKKILENFNGFTVEQTKFINNSFFTFVMK